VWSSSYLKIPRKRIGVLIGPEGKVKKEIERRLKVNLSIDSVEGDISITPSPENDDPSTIFRARDIALAIGRGFSPERAFRLLDDEDSVLQVIDLREIVGRSPSNIKRIKGRVIGREGKIRRMIEELTGTSISVYGHTISIIGRVEEVDIAREAIMMLIKGSQHGTVTRFLHRMRRKLKRKMLEIWETSPKDLET